MILFIKYIFFIQQKFQKFHVPNAMEHSGCTDSTQATASMVIVPVRTSKMLKSSTGDNNFDKRKGKFQSN